MVTYQLVMELLLPDVSTQLYLSSEAATVRTLLKSFLVDLSYTLHKLKDWRRLLFSVVTAIWFVCIVCLIIICFIRGQGYIFLLACWSLAAVVISATLFCITFLVFSFQVMFGQQPLKKLSG